MRMLLPKNKKVRLKKRKKKEAEKPKKKASWWARLKKKFQGAPDNPRTKLVKSRLRQRGLTEEEIKRLRGK